MNILKRLRKPSLSIALLSLVFFYSCDQEESKILEVSSEIELVSPMGFEIAENIAHLKQILELPINYKIIKVEFLERDKFNVAFIDYIDEFGVGSNYVSARGDVKYSGNQFIERQYNNSRYGDSWRVSCDGCENCRAGGTMDPDGNLTFQCESSCCVLTVVRVE